ncbi:MAG: L-lactate permease [Rhodospirillales bacterium]|nr:MAG: L-lactate permease [Rhodospirillales bacterium]
MPPILAATPLLIVIALLASGRVGALVAGAAGLAATVAAIVLSPPAGAALGGFLAHHGAVGAWLAWQVVAIVVGGVFFHRCVQSRARIADAAGATPTPADTHRQLYFIAFLLGPFAESVTGFGVGTIVALAAIARLGLGGLPALTFALYSQSFVPWGALAVGTTVGGLLAGITPTDLGLRCALLQAPIHLGYLLLFWRYCAQAGSPLDWRRRLDDLAWTASAVAGVWAAHAIVDVEIAGAAPLGALVALRWWRDARPDGARIASAALGAAPYIALTLALLATRIVAPLQAALKTLAAWRPLDGQPAFAPFYAPGFWLVAVGVATLVAARAAPAPVLRATAAAAWRPSVVTLLFVVMAAYYVAGGMAAAIADALHRAAGDSAAFGAPFFAALGGFLTGSGAASNAMLMPMQTALAGEARLDRAWMAAVQNGVTANLTMLSPIRVSMGVALLALAGGESAAYRRVWPLALPPLLAGLAAVGLLLATRG